LHIHSRTSRHKNLHHNKPYLELFNYISRIFLSLTLTGTYECRKEPLINIARDDLKWRECVLWKNVLSQYAVDVRVRAFIKNTLFERVHTPYCIVDMNIGFVKGPYWNSCHDVFLWHFKKFLNYLKSYLRNFKHKFLLKIYKFNFNIKNSHDTPTQRDITTWPLPYVLQKSTLSDWLWL
jgi:hypothetical protein